MCLGLISSTKKQNKTKNKKGNFSFHFRIMTESVWQDLNEWLRGTHSGSLGPAEVRLEPGYHTLDCGKTLGLAENLVEVVAGCQSQSRCTGMAKPFQQVAAGHYTSPPVPILCHSQEPRVTLK